MKVTVVTGRGYVLDGDLTTEDLDIAWLKGRVTLNVPGGTIDVHAIDHITIPTTKETSE
jgi:hypothetical protein